MARDGGLRFRRLRDPVLPRGGMNRAPAGPLDGVGAAREPAR